MEPGAIQKVVPLRLASLSDRLGNIVVQIPVIVLVATFTKQRVSGDVATSLAWHPKAKPPPANGSSGKLVRVGLSQTNKIVVQNPARSRGEEWARTRGLE